jgi:hypothetical protein
MRKSNQATVILDAKNRIAKTRLFAPFSLTGSEITDAPNVSGLISGVGAISQSSFQSPVFSSIEDVRPKPEDFIGVPFRAISQSVAPGYWVDWSKPGVLEASVSMLYGQPVFKNHDFWDVEDWIGVVAKSYWDPKGENSGGIPGINADLLIDWKANPLVARGLLVKPPAIKSDSVTVKYQYDFSHPDLVEQDRFWRLMGQEVEGEIVRLIATKIMAYWELSLVFRGAQDENVIQPFQDDDPEPDDTVDPNESMSARRSLSKPVETTKERNTVKLTPELKTKLGLTSHTAEEVPDDVVLQRASTLADQASIAEQMTANARVECLRVATLAECGSAEGTLDPALAGMINQASGASLDGLTKMYGQKVATKFTATCQNCGGKVGSVRSSIETKPDETGDKTTPVKPVKRLGNLHG